MNRMQWSAKKLSAFGIFLLIALVALAQGDWSLGPYSFTSGRPSAPLQYSLAGSGGLSSYAFVSGVGGVDFSGVARPDAILNGKTIALHYDKESADGARLKVTADTAIVAADLPDWMLIPIAKFADSDFDACVSLFGPETNETVYDIVYHQSFQNTLLGIRLLQADMLLFNLGETWRLPQRGGLVILGLGESAPNQMDRTSAIAVQNAIRGPSFQSWVMTDQGEDVVFTLRNGRLELTGAPYYYFWTSNVEQVVSDQQRLEAQAIALLNAGRVAEHNRIVEQINGMTPIVTEVTSLTQNLKNTRDALRRFNPAVFDAATATMRYSALFRYVRRESPGAWRNFLRETAGAVIQPNVITPTKWAR